MPITLRHDVAALPMPKVDPQKYNTGMGMAKQERKYAMDAEMLNQRQDYAMDAMQMRNAQENQGPPSLGQQGMMIDQAIRAGSFDPDTVKALRENVRKTNEAFRSRNINNEQRQQTMRNLQEERDLLWGMGYPSRKVESVAGKGNKEPMTGRQYYQNNPKEFNERVEQARKIRIDAGQTKFTNTDLYNDVINDWEARQKFFDEVPGSQPQGQPQSPAMGAQPTPNAPATQSGQPQASFTGGNPAFGSSSVLAQGGFQQGGSAYSPSIALAPAHPDYKAPPTPTDRRDEKGYVIMSDGSKVDPRDSFAMSTGGRGQQDVMRLTHPDGSQKEQRPDNILEYYDSNASVGQPLTYAPQSMESGRWGGQQIFGIDPILAMPASPPIPGVATSAILPTTQMSQQPAQQQPMPAQQQTSPLSTQSPGVRKWGSIDGRYSVEGEMIRTRVTPGGDPLTSEMVTIRRKDNGKEIDVPLYKLSREDQAFVNANPQFNYQMRNQGMSEMQQRFDPSNPENVAARTPDQSIVNPQKQTLGSEYKGRYGLGGADYGINPATGNRVTASVRPGGTALEYDEPVGAPGTAMGGRKGSLNYLGGKRKVDQKKKAPVVGVDVSPNASPATELDAASAIESAKAVIADPNATTQDKYDAARSLVRSGVPEEEVGRLENAAKPTTTVKPATPTTTPVQPATPQQNANAVKRKRPMLSASTPLDKDGKPVQDPISSGAQWIYDQGSDAAIAARRWYYGFPDENNASPAPKPASTKPPVASQESRDWQNWWSTNRPDFESSGGEPSTWTSAKDSKKQLTGSVLRISEFTEGTRYVSIKDEKGRVFTLDIKRLSGADQKKLKDMYKAKKNESAGVKK